MAKGDKMQNTKINIQRCSLALAFNTVFYPFTYPEIFDSLRAHKYTISPIPTGNLPSGARIYVGGLIAKRGIITINSNDGKRILAAEGPDIDQVIASAEELIEIARNDFHVDLDNELSYMELSADLIVQNGMNPSIDIQKFTGNKFDVFNDILDANTSSCLISLSPRGVNSNNLKWFDIRIEPRSTRPNDAFYVNVVYRDQGATGVLNFARNLGKEISEILNKIHEA